ncbi:hypothetical protein BUE93_04820 [Chromobacterium amazonense]|uniref:Uncharacterized protein n=1 Tax=Chromobacterium amazonense TaxID=1382803 RepID=A0A2S9X7P1_9NEIS|nr:hypothetical protein [Chromobacterium amazonense]PRP71733.1 hypothetical protein BUE93_04820 [Chromobacterium amazonense]
MATTFSQQHQAVNKYLAKHHNMPEGVTAYAAKYMLKCKTEGQLMAALDEYLQLPPALNQH